MDLSFSLEPSRRGLDKSVSLEDIKAAAASRRLDSAQRETGGRPIQGAETDSVQILACMLAGKGLDSAGMEVLGGSFNPHVARQLMVGEEDEDGVYRCALADLQGWAAQ